MGSSVTVRPLGAKLLVRPEEKKDTVKDGIVIPGRVATRGDNRTAFVLSVGPSYKGSLSEGSRVIIAPYCGTEIKIGQDTMLFIKEGDVLAEVED